MKKSLQTISEVEIAAFVLAAAAVALVLMVGHAVWKDFARHPQPNSQTDEPIKEAICADPRILPPDPALEFPRKFRRELFLKERRMLPKAHFLAQILSPPGSGWIDEQGQRGDGKRL